MAAMNLRMHSYTETLNEMPFHSMADHDIDVEFQNSKKRLSSLMEGTGLRTFFKEHKLSKLLNCDNTFNCNYYCELSFNKKRQTWLNCLNIFSLNIRSLPKHGGELVNFLQLLEANFHVIVLTEINSRNLSVVEHLFKNHDF